MRSAPPEVMSPPLVGFEPPTQDPAVKVATAAAVRRNGSSYSPATRKVQVTPMASMYERHHELAHGVQHRLQCRPWRFYTTWVGIRLIGYIATLWLEYDAMRRARAQLEWTGNWNQRTAREARRSFMSYVKRKELA